MIPIKLVGIGAEQKAATVDTSLPIPARLPPARWHYLQPGALQLAALPPLSLYIHFPWCVRKCPTATSIRTRPRAELPEQAYLDAVRADLEQSLPLIWGRKIHTVFIGGGTPSLMSAAGLDRCCPMVRTLLPLEIDAEITMEANPGTFEAEKFKAYRASGVNRLSIGIQSFNARSPEGAGPHPRRWRSAPRGRYRATPTSTISTST